MSIKHMAERYPRSAKNTLYARKLAQLWEKTFNREFPGGHENAWLRWLNPSRDQRDSGHWNWELVALYGDQPFPVIGSSDPARECLKDPALIEW